MNPPSFATALVSALLLGSVALCANQPAIPAPVTAENYPDLLQRPPFRRVLTLSESLVLSGVATLPSGKVVTVWDRASARSFLVTASPNPQGWKLIELSENTDLRSVAATIAAGDQKLTLRFDPERLTPPKLDNTSKPAPRSEGAVVVEALLRSLQPAAARDFEALPPEAQEAFRKSFSNYLAAFPTASDAKRLAFVQRALDEARPGPKEPKEKEPKEAREPASPKGDGAPAKIPNDQPPPEPSKAPLSPDTPPELPTK
jgi:hypothetical protein